MAEPTDAVVEVLSEIVERFGCDRTLQIGSSDLRLASALAQLHARAGAGHHTVLARDRTEAEVARSIWTSLLNGGSARSTLLDEPSERALVALPAQDLVVIEECAHSEQAFVEFVLADRWLEPGAVVAVIAPFAPAMRGLAEFILRSRAYEQRSSVDAPIVVLRKLGRQITAVELGPASRTSDPTTTFVAAEQESAAHEPGSVAHLRRLLVDAEQRASEVVSLRAELSATRRELAAVSEQRRSAEAALSQLQGSTSWRLTAPLRRAMAHIRR